MAGRLELIVGPMYSGKSEELIRRITRAKIAGRDTVVFKPAIDSRYSLNAVQSHSGATVEALPVSTIFDLGVLAEGYEVVGIDEIQFFGVHTLVRSIQSMVDKNQIVIVSGLDMTYRKEPWEPVPSLLAIADRIDKLNAVCHKCGADAILTQRLVDGKPAPFTGETVLVGGLESYEARCRDCHEKG